MTSNAPKIIPAEKSFAAGNLHRVITDLLYWAEVPPDQGHSGDWADAFKSEITRVTDAAIRSFSDDPQICEAVRTTKSKAFAFIGLLHSVPSLATVPVNEWPVKSQIAKFDELAKLASDFENIENAYKAERHQPDRTAGKVLSETPQPQAHPTEEAGSDFGERSDDVISTGSKPILSEREKIACDVLLMHSRTYSHTAIHAQNFANQMRTAGCSTVKPVVDSLRAQSLIDVRFDRFQLADVYHFDPEQIESHLEQQAEHTSANIPRHSSPMQKTFAEKIRELARTAEINPRGLKRALNEHLPECIPQSGNTGLANQRFTDTGESRWSDLSVAVGKIIQGKIVSREILRELATTFDGIESEQPAFRFDALDIQNQSKILKRLHATGTTDTPENRESTWNELRQEGRLNDLDSETVVNLVKTKRIAKHSDDSEKRTMANAVFGLLENYEATRQDQPESVVDASDQSQFASVTDTVPTVYSFGPLVGNIKDCVKTIQPKATRFRRTELLKFHGKNHFIVDVGNSRFELHCRQESDFEAMRKRGPAKLYSDIE